MNATKMVILAFVLSMQTFVYSYTACVIRLIMILIVIKINFFKYFREKIDAIFFIMNLLWGIWMIKNLVLFDL